MQVVEVWPLTLSGSGHFPPSHNLFTGIVTQLSGRTAAAPELPRDKPEINPEILDHANHTPFVPIQEGVILIEILLSGY